MYDHLIYRSDKPIHAANPNDLTAYTVAIVKGYSFPDYQHFGEILEAGSIHEAFQMVVDGRADLTVANNQDFYLQMRLYGYPLVLGDVHSENILRARVHKSRADLLGRLNSAITQLKANKQFSLLLAKRLRGTQNLEGK